MPDGDLRSNVTKAAGWLELDKDSQMERSSLKDEVPLLEVEQLWSGFSDLLLFFWRKSCRVRFKH